MLTLVSKYQEYPQPFLDFQVTKLNSNLIQDLIAFVGDTTVWLRQTAGDPFSTCI